MPSLGAGPAAGRRGRVAPARRRRSCGTAWFGETWYRGLTLSLTKRFSEPIPVPRELHTVEGGRQLDRLPERFHSPGQRIGTQSRGWRRGCRSASMPDAERGRRSRISGTASSSAGCISLPGDHPAVIDHHGRLGAAVQRSWRVPISTATATAARRRPIGRGTTPGDSEPRASAATPAGCRLKRPSTCGCAAGSAARQGRGLDAMFEVFNLFNRTNYVGDQRGVRHRGLPRAMRCRPSASSLRRLRRSRSSSRQRSFF